MNRLFLFALILIGCNPDGPESPSNPNTFKPSVFFKMDGRQYQEHDNGSINGVRIPNAQWFKDENHDGTFNTYISCSVDGPDSFKYAQYLFILIKDYPLKVGKTYNHTEINTFNTYIDVQGKHFRLTKPNLGITITKSENGLISGTFHFDTMRSSYVSYPVAYVTDGIFTDIKED